MHNFIKQSAALAGFDACGIAQANRLDDDARYLKKWLAESKHGEMTYLEKNFEKRVNPAALVPGCKSIIVVLLNYFTENSQPDNVPKIALYAHPALDYHSVVKQKLQQLEEMIVRKYGQTAVNQTCQHLFTDSAPVLERRWAERAGLGWIGRNTQLINNDSGSWCFIGVLMLNIATVYDLPVKNRCGNCRKCIDACPTQALSDNGIDAKHCISYQTIEKKGKIDSEFQKLQSRYVAGCDICAQVCPWNKKWEKQNRHDELKPMDELSIWNINDWENFTIEQYNSIFRRSAIGRMAFGKLKENIKMLELQGL
jgi:epoxyqueuosine reductase